MPNSFDQSSTAFLASLDAEIERLQSLRQQIADALGSSSQAKRAPSAKTKPKRKGMSEEGRRRVAAAQKARWAKLKKDNAAKKTPAKKTVTGKKTVAKKAAAKKTVPAKTAEQA